MISEKLNRFINNEARTDFRNYEPGHIRALLRHFSDPQQGFASIHIAGTNGKGSVAYMLKANGFPAGASDLSSDADRLRAIAIQSSRP